MRNLSRRAAIHRSLAVVTAAAGGSTLSAAAPFPAPLMTKLTRPRKTVPIRIGQIGVGHAHAAKLAVFRASTEFEVVGIVEPDPILRRQAERQSTYAGLPWMTQEQLLNTDNLQLVLIETRVRDLLTAAETCVNAGKHIHLDKPAGESLPHFARILASAERQNLLVQMGYMYRYNPGVTLLREFLKQGWLGDLFEVHAVMSKQMDQTGRNALAEYPGGTMFELGCHLIDLVIGILGPPTSVHPFAHHSLAESTTESNATTSTDTAVGTDTLLDNMLAVFNYPQASATIRSSVLEVNGSARRHLVVCGTRGTFQIQPLDDPAVIVSLSDAHEQYAKGTQTITLPKYERYVDDAVAIAEIIRQEREPDYTWQHDLEVQKAVLLASKLSIT